MDNYNEIDGLPGLTLQGKPGNTGDRGSTTFFNILNTNDKKYLGNSTITCVSFDLSEYSIQPLVGDYVIETFQHKTFIYIINEIDEEFNLLYIGVCDLYKSVNDITLKITKTKKAVRYDTWRQSYDSSDNIVIPDISEKSGVYHNSVFEFTTKNNISDYRFELEFKHGPYKLGYASSCMADKYNSDASVTSSTPLGFAENYIFSNQKTFISFDNEDLGDFNIILKDFDENNKLSYQFTKEVNIPDAIRNKLKTISYDDNSLNSYNVYLYAYKKESISQYSSFYKIFLGDITSALVNIQ